MNSLRGRWENFWSSERTSVLRLVDPADVLDKMVYALTNPVKDNLVAKVTEWRRRINLGEGRTSRPKPKAGGDDRMC
jgi:hypothetical protein